MKKIMVSVALALVVSAFALTVTAQEEATDMPAAEQAAPQAVIPGELVGKWRLVAIGTRIEIEFTRDGKLYFETGGSRNENAVTVEGKTLKTTASWGSGSADWKVSKDTLTISKLRGNSGLPMGKFKKQ